MTDIDRKLFVGGIDRETAEDEIEKYFKAYGSLESVSLMRTSAGRSRGFAFVIFENQTDCASCLDAGIHTIGDKKVDVKKCEERKDDDDPEMEEGEIPSGRGLPISMGAFMKLVKPEDFQVPNSAPVEERKHKDKTPPERKHKTPPERKHKTPPPERKHKIPQESKHKTPPKKETISPVPPNLKISAGLSFSEALNDPKISQAVKALEGSFSSIIEIKKKDVKPIIDVKPSHPVKPSRRTLLQDPPMKSSRPPENGQLPVEFGKPGFSIKVSNISPNYPPETIVQNFRTFGEVLDIDVMDNSGMIWFGTKAAKQCALDAGSLSIDGILCFISDSKHKSSRKHHESSPRHSHKRKHHHDSDRRSTKIPRLDEMPFDEQPPPPSKKMDVDYRRKPPSDFEDFPPSEPEPQQQKLFQSNQSNQDFIPLSSMPPAKMSMMNEQQTRLPNQQMMGEQQTRMPNLQIMGEQQNRMSNQQMMGDQQQNRMKNQQMIGDQQQNRMPNQQMMSERQTRMPNQQMMSEQQTRMPNQQMMSEQQTRMPNQQMMSEQQNRMPNLQIMGEQQNRMPNLQIMGEQQNRMPNQQMLSDQQQQNRMKNQQMMVDQQTRMPNQQMIGDQQTRMPNQQMMSQQNPIPNVPRLPDLSNPPPRSIPPRPVHPVPNRGPPNQPQMIRNFPAPQPQGFAPQQRMRQSMQFPAQGGPMGNRLPFMVENPPEWAQTLMRMLNQNVPMFNPQVPPPFMPPAGAAAVKPASKEPPPADNKETVDNKQFVDDTKKMLSALMKMMMSMMGKLSTPNSQLFNLMKANLAQKLDAAEKQIEGRKPVQLPGTNVSTMGDTSKKMSFQASGPVRQPARHHQMSTSRPGASAPGPRMGLLEKNWWDL